MRQQKDNDAYDVLRALNVERTSKLGFVLLPGIRGKLSEMDVPDVVKLYEPHVAKRRGAEWA
jgi:hypothetical protein